MNQLTPAQIDELNGLMDQRFTRAREEIAAVSGRLHDERGPGAWSDRPTDPEERTLAEIDLATDNALVGQDAQDARDIVAARRRLAAGTYGVCIDCGEPIGYERLLAYPTAKRCIGCQREHEREKDAGAGRRVP